VAEGEQAGEAEQQLKAGEQREAQYLHHQHRIYRERRAAAAPARDREWQARHG
jgi:hypothetical protein